MDQSMRKEHSIADTLEPYLSHTNPWNYKQYDEWKNTCNWYK